MLPEPINDTEVRTYCTPGQYPNLLTVVFLASSHQSSKREGMFREAGKRQEQQWGHTGVGVWVRACSEPTERPARASQLAPREARCWLSS